MQIRKVTPLFRIFDEAKAREFYLDYLGFSVDWEHRFESDFPLYMQISLGALVIHLTEHYGDCIPGSAIRIEITGKYRNSANLDVIIRLHELYGTPKTDWHEWVFVQQIIYPYVLDQSHYDKIMLITLLTSLTGNVFTLAGIGLWFSSKRHDIVNEEHEMPLKLFRTF